LPKKRNAILSGTRRKLGQVTAFKKIAGGARAVMWAAIHTTRERYTTSPSRDQEQ
jgi:hypothetical protein